MSMNPPIVAPALAGHTIGNVDSNFVIAEWQDTGGPAGPPRLIAPLHLHRKDDEAWYVLEGTLLVRKAMRLWKSEPDAVCWCREGCCIPIGTPAPGALGTCS